MTTRRKRINTTGKKEKKTKRTNKAQKNANDENIANVIPSGPSLLSLGIENLLCIHNHLGIDYLSRRRMEKACGLPILAIGKISQPPLIDLVLMKKSHVIFTSPRGISIMMKINERKEYQINIYIKNNWHRGIVYGVDGKRTTWKLKAKEFITNLELPLSYILTEAWIVNSYVEGVLSFSLHQEEAIIDHDGKYGEKIKQLRRHVSRTNFLKIFHYYRGKYGNGMKMKRISWKKKIKSKPK